MECTNADSSEHGLYKPQGQDRPSKRRQPAMLSPLSKPRAHQKVLKRTSVSVDEENTSTTPEISADCLLEVPIV